MTNTEKFDTMTAETTITADGVLQIIAVDGDLRITLPPNEYNKTLIADYSGTTGIKDITTGEGAQVIIFNGEGGNVARITDEIGNKTIEAGSGGDIIIDNNTKSVVHIKAGSGEDTIVASGSAKEYIDLSAGGATKVIAENGAILNNYNVNSGAGFLFRDIDNIVSAVENKIITFGKNELIYNDNATMKVVPTNANDNITSMNIYDNNQQKAKMAWTDKQGGALDVSNSEESMMLLGNYDNKKYAETTITGSDGNDTIFAGNGDIVSVTGGNDSVEINHSNTAAANLQGTTINLGSGESEGETTVTGFKTGFSSKADKVKINKRSGFSFSFIGDALRVIYNKVKVFFGINSKEITLNDVSNKGKVENLLVSDETGEDVRYSLLDNNSTLQVTDKTNEAQEYYGIEHAEGETNGTVIDYQKYEQELFVNMSDNYHNIDKVVGGAGKTGLIGDDSSNTLQAGRGESSIWSGAGRDEMQSYSGDDKVNANTFYYVSGDNRDTLSGFEFGTGGTADKLNTFGQAVTGLEVSGDDLKVKVGDNSEDELLIKDGANQIIQANAYGNDYVAEVGDSLTYDKKVNAYMGTDNATLTVTDTAGKNVEIWSNGADGKIYNNVKDIDASSYNGKSKLIGNDMDNVITASSGNSSLWGGFNGDDTLIGNDGADTFYYLQGNGNDVISNAESNDIINLMNINLDDFDIDTTVAESSVLSMRFSNGETLNIINSSSEVNIKLADGTTYTAADIVNRKRT